MDEANQQLDLLKNELEGAITDRDASRAGLDEANEQLDLLKNELEIAITDRDASRAGLDEANQQLDLLKNELEIAIINRNGIQSRSEEAHKRIDLLREGLHELAAKHDAADLRADALAHQLLLATRQSDQLVAAREEIRLLREQLHKLAAEHDAADSRADALAHQLLLATKQSDQLAAAGEEIRQRDGEIQSLRGLLHSHQTDLAGRHGELDQLRQQLEHKTQAEIRALRRAAEAERLQQEETDRARETQELAEKLLCNLITIPHDRSGDQRGVRAAALARDLMPQTLRIPSRLKVAVAVWYASLWNRRAILQRAEVARSRRQWRRAAKLFQAALRRKVDDPPIWVQFGHALKELGHASLAEVAYSAALGYDEAVTDSHLQMGHVRKMLGKLGEAQLAYMRTLVLDPDDTDASRELADLGWSAAELGPLKLRIGEQ